MFKFFGASLRHSVDATRCVRALAEPQDGFSAAQTRASLHYLQDKLVRYFGSLNAYMVASRETQMKFVGDVEEFVTDCVRNREHPDFQMGAIAMLTYYKGIADGHRGAVSRLGEEIAKRGSRPNFIDGCQGSNRGI